MSTPATAAYYARTSTEEQKERHTIQSQVSALEAEIAKQGDRLIGRYIDDGCSGALLDRPGLEQLRADARERRFQKLYIHSPDRLARDLMLQLLIVKELRQRKIEVVFLSQRFGNSPSDQLLFQMLGAISEFERAQILERTRRGKLHKARAGAIIGGIPKFGYRYVGGTDTAFARYEINPNEADTVLEIFRLFLEPGVEGVCSLARELHRRGLKNRSGNTKWAKSSLSRILKDSVYAGTWHYNKYMACEPLKAADAPMYRGNTSRRLRPESQWIPVKAPAIISEAQFAAVQEKLVRNRDLSQRNAKYQYLLKGVVFCGCDRRMYGYPCHESPRYKCADKYLSHPLPRTCHRPSVSTPKLDSAVWRALISALDRPEVVAAKINQAHANKQEATARFAEKRSDVARALADFAAQEQRLLDAYAASVITLPQLQAQLAALATRKKRLEQENAALNQQAPNSPPPLSEADVRAYFSAVKEKAHTATFEHFDLCRGIIRQFVDRVTVDGDKVCLKAVLPNPVSTASMLSKYYGRNVHQHAFLLTFNLRDPEDFRLEKPSLIDM